MFKWYCLGVAVVALLVFGWMVNDMRLEIKHGAARVNEQLPQILDNTRQATTTVNEKLPRIVERVDQTTKTVSDSLPGLLAKAETTAETVAELSEDVKEFKVLWSGLNPQAQDAGLLRYATGVLKLIGSQDAVIGTEKVFGKELSNPQPAKDWAAATGKEAAGLAVVCKSRPEVLTSLCRTKFRSQWLIQFPGKPPVPLIDWVKQNHPESRELNEGGRT